MKKLIMILSSLALMSLGWTARAGGDFHDPPFSFLFGNHIDTHQETFLKLNRHTGEPRSLFGKFYIIYTGATDPVSGLPVARHPRGAGEHNEECGVDVDCVTGWIMRGVPGAAKFVSHSGVNGDDHPVWLVNRAEEALAPTTGMVIPQPGSFTHFHWITTTSTDPRAVSVPAECDKPNAGELESAGPNQVCDGWFLQIRAKRAFAFEHGGELIPVRPGLDNRSHLNIVTNYKPWPDGTITTTRD